MAEVEQKLRDYHFCLMKILAQNSNCEQLKIEDFQQSFRIFSSHFASKNISLELKLNGLPLFPVPFCSTGEKPKLIILGINPQLDPKHVAMEKSIGGKTYEEYSRNYCNSNILRFSALEQKSSHYLNKVFPVALGLKYGQALNYSEFRGKRTNESAFDALVDEFNFMAVESVPYYSTKFKDTGSTSILTDEFYKTYSQVLFHSIEDNIEDGGTLFLFYTPKQFYNIKHLVSLYSERYWAKFHDTVENEKLIISWVELNKKKVLFIVCKYATQKHGINLPDEKIRFWQLVKDYKLKHWKHNC